MDVCSKNPNRTAPVSDGGGLRRADLPLCSRTNGWSWPPHPFQLLAWLLYLFFAITGFGVFVPLLPTHWVPAGYIVSSPAARPPHAIATPLTKSAEWFLQQVQTCALVFVDCYLATCRVLSHSGCEMKLTPNRTCMTTYLLCL